jgi:signal transduction histidine kinase
VDGGTALLAFAEIAPETHVGVAVPELLRGLEVDLVKGRAIAFVVFMTVVLVAGNLLIRSTLDPISELARTAEEVGRGDVSRRFTSSSTNEVGALAHSLEVMRGSLERQLIVISVQAGAIRRATQRIVSARDDERRRMAQDLHDGVQQQLVMLRLRIGLLGDRLDSRQREALGQEVEAVLTRLRETSQAIFPSILADRGLAGALYSLAASSVVPVELDLDPDPLPRLGTGVEAGLYFITCEALNNVVKHAGAERIRIRARLRPDSVLLMVSDYGRGFDVDAVTAGSGLQNLRDRAVALGGVAHVRSEPGVGSVVAVRVPLGSTRAAALGSVRATLQEEQDRGDAAVEIAGVAQAELSEYGVGVFLDRALPDDELQGDG